jgi:hypothetical protein
VTYLALFDKKVFAKKGLFGGCPPPPVVALEGALSFGGSRVSLDFIHNLSVNTTNWGVKYVQIDLEFLRVKAT